MQHITLIGILAGTLTTIAFLPQVIKTWRSHSADDISAGMLLLFSSGLVLWLVYGIAIEALPIILANSVTLVLTFAIPGISISGHIGGLVGGALAALAVFEIEERTRSTAASLAVCGALSAALVLGCLWAAQQFAHPLLG